MKWRVDMRDEDGQVAAGHIVAMDDRSYLFALEDGDCLFDQFCKGSERFHRERGRSAKSCYVVPYRYCGQWHRSRIKI